MALAAAFAGDDELIGLDGATRKLATGVASAAAPLLRCQHDERSRRIAAEMSSLVAGPGADRVRDRWPNMPTSIRPLVGLKRVVEVFAVPQWPIAPIPSHLSALTGDELIERLSKLSVTLLAKAAKGERWAVHLTMKGAARLCQASDVNPRLAPAVAWIGAALSGDDEVLETLAESWPATLGRALLDAPTLVGQRGGPVAGDEGNELEEKLKQEMSRRG